MTRPALHRLSVVLQAPVQCWAAPDGHVRPDDPDGYLGNQGAQGVYCGDERVVAELSLAVAGRQIQHVHTDEPGGDRAEYRYLLDAPELGLDPQIELVRERRATSTGLTETLTIRSASTAEQPFDVSIRVTPDYTTMESVKAGLAGSSVPIVDPLARVEPDPGDPRPDASTAVGWHWRDADTAARLSVEHGTLSFDRTSYELRWSVTVAPRGSVSFGWALELSDAVAPFVAASGDPIAVPEVGHAPTGQSTEALNRLLRMGINDLNGLRMAEAGHPETAFLAAGAPWYLTLFGRDSLISARLLLPHEPSLAMSTLRVLANRQGRKTDPATAEQPGKILHEVRRVALDLHHSRRDTDGVERRLVLPPEYFGTIDATLLWILVLNDVQRTGADVDDLLPALRSALGWLREHADADGDGFVEYVDQSGTGLANQGWKDSADSVRWANGELAEGPIALVEVQGYAHAAAVAGARLLALDGDEVAAQEWTDWAAQLATRFRESFWVADHFGRYPALALDAHKRPVDGVSSNMGHLLGTQILTPAEQRIVVDRLRHPSVCSGYGIRTLSTTNAGYWPLSYHVGSVWSHDTAVIIDGMLRDGFDVEAAELAGQLLRAADGFDGRLPELFGGHGRDEVNSPVPYPASCRPQAWAAATAITVARALVPMDPLAHVSR